MKILVMAGGTGGHVFPALAVAEELRARGHEVVWMGAPDSFESRTVPKSGFAMEQVRIAGLRGKGLMTLLWAPLRLLRAVFEATQVLSRQRPDAVLGMGGFVAGPGGLATWMKRIPLVIHEQNAAPGMTNRILARLAGVVLQAFPDSLPNATTVGNPVRPAIAALPPAAERFRLRDGKRMRLLVIGGSQGARALNQCVPAALARLEASLRPQVLHQAGRTLDIAQNAYAEAGVEARVEPFIDDMPAAYAEADLVICRAGASTIAELCAAGCAAILVPFPFAVDDHQTRNGQHLTRVGAARLIPESELDAERLAGEMRSLLGDRTTLEQMACAARAQAWPESTRAIADACLQAAERSP